MISQRRRPNCGTQRGMRNTKIHRQYGAVPFAIDKGGRVRVVLLTSRQTGRWVIPKGWPMAGRKPTQVAVREAYEEAGLRGVVSRGNPVGRYRYRKRLLTGKFVTCEVAVFLLRVRRELTDWPESDQRVRAWFSLEVAAKLVAERDLAKLILGAVSDRLMQRQVMRT
jgi:8-oxo-dGTP pyrophosphatase MutT (NUDIX family)